MTMIDNAAAAVAAPLAQFCAELEVWPGGRQAVLWRGRHRLAHVFYIYDEVEIVNMARWPWVASRPTTAAALAQEIADAAKWR